MYTDNIGNTRYLYPEYSSRQIIAEEQYTEKSQFPCWNSRRGMTFGDLS